MARKEGLDKQASKLGKAIQQLVKDAYARGYKAGKQSTAK